MKRIIAAIATVVAGGVFLGGCFLFPPNTGGSVKCQPPLHRVTDGPWTGTTHLEDQAGNRC